MVLIPEIPFSYESVAAAIRRREEGGAHYTIVVVAEGAPAGGLMRAAREAAGDDLREVRFLQGRDRHSYSTTVCDCSRKYCGR